MSLATRVSPSSHSEIQALRAAVQALRAEWIKARTVAGSAWLLAGAAVLTVIAGTAADSAARCSSATCGLDPAKVTFTGVYLGQESG